MPPIISNNTRYDLPPKLRVGNRGTDAGDSLYNIPNPTDRNGAQIGRSGVAFVIKLNNNGIAQWARFINSSDDDDVVDMAIDSSNNIYVIGNSIAANLSNISDNIKFGNDFYLKPQNSGTMVYLAKLTSDGNSSYFKWFDKMKAQCVTVDSQTVYVGVSSTATNDNKYYFTSSNNLVYATLNQIATRIGTYDKPANGIVGIISLDTVSGINPLGATWIESNTTALREIKVKDNMLHLLGDTDIISSSLTVSATYNTTTSITKPVTSNKAVFVARYELDALLNNNIIKSVPDNYNLATPAYALMTTLTTYPTTKSNKVKDMLWIDGSGIEAAASFTIDILGNYYVGGFSTSSEQSIRLGKISKLLKPVTSGDAVFMAKLVTEKIPSAPTITSVIPGDKTAIVSFTPPIDNGRSPILKYIVYQYPVATGQTVRTIEGTSSPITISGLVNGVSYSFKVKAVNLLGEGLFSNQSETIVPQGVPSKMVQPTVTAGDASVTLTFTIPLSNGSGITKYIVSQYPAVNNVIRTIEYNFGQSPITVTELTNGKTYNFSIKAVNGIGAGEDSFLSNSVTPLGPPSIPRNIQVTRGNQNIVVNFNPSQSTGGSQIKQYNVQYKPVSSITAPSQITVIPPTQTTQATTLSATITGLQNGVEYNVQVNATNKKLFTSALSEPSTITPATTPYTIIVLSAVAGDSSAILNFTVPNNGGDAITSYIVTPYIDTIIPSDPITFTTTQLPLVVSGLTNNTMYTFKVKAVNSIGAGAEGLSANAVMPKKVENVKQL